MTTTYVILLTYAPAVDHPRAEYSRLTLESVLTNLRTASSLQVHIATDGSHPLHISSLVDICSQFKISPSITDAQRRGYGASYNLATQHCHSGGDYFLMLEDDWRLTQVLDLDPLIEALDEGPLGCIRLGYLGRTRSLKGSLIFSAGQSFLLLDPDSEEPHVFAGHPRLETKAFQRKVGPWPEGLDPGSTEFAISVTPESRTGVVWPLDLVKTWGDLFVHIGTEQARSDQRSLDATGSLS